MEYLRANDRGALLLLLHLKRQEEGEVARLRRERAVCRGPTYHKKVLVSLLSPLREGAGGKTY